MSDEKMKKAPNVQSVPPGVSKDGHKMHFSKIAALVKKTRAARGMSLRELAEATELSHQQILRVEQGNCSVESALAVLKALAIPKMTRADIVAAEMRHYAMAS